MDSAVRGSFSPGSAPKPSPRGSGIAFALSAFLLWAAVPIYFKVLLHVPMLEVVSHRVLWSVLFLGVLITARRGWPEVARCFRTPRRFGLMVLTTALIGTNWLVYIWAVTSNRVLEGSLGYFINPLVSVAFGVVFLRERLPRLQGLALLFAGVGVGNLVFRHGQVPWLALGVAGTFALYGLLRKVAAVDALTGLFVEMLLLFPAAVIWLVRIVGRGESHFLLVDRTTDLLLVGASFVSFVPLLLFIAATRRLPLSTLAFIQYVSPVGQLLLAIFAYGEPFTAARKVTFAFIWAALLLYTGDLVVRTRSASRP
ncbi:MAG: EamA family transporter RarD [Deltaproteobacteria bacterium]|nr:EamA family transporter RarD [Deltaproteobacteria bacterium]